MCEPPSHTYRISSAHLKAEMTRHLAQTFLTLHALTHASHPLSLSPLLLIHATSIKSPRTRNPYRTQTYRHITSIFPYSRNPRGSYTLPWEYRTPGLHNFPMILYACARARGRINRAQRNIHSTLSFDSPFSKVMYVCVCGVHAVRI